MKVSVEPGWLQVTVEAVNADAAANVLVRAQKYPPTDYELTYVTVALLDPREVMVNLRFLLGEGLRGFQSDGEAVEWAHLDLVELARTDPASG